LLAGLADGDFDDESGRRADSFFAFLFQSWSGAYRDIFILGIFISLDHSAQRRSGRAWHENRVAAIAVFRPADNRRADFAEPALAHMVEYDYFAGGDGGDGVYVCFAAKPVTRDANHIQIMLGRIHTNNTNHDRFTIRFIRMSAINSWVNEDSHRR